jgi:hypothetical protein
MAMAFGRVISCARRLLRIQGYHSKIKLIHYQTSAGHVTISMLETYCAIPVAFSWVCPFVVFREAPDHAFLTLPAGSIIEADHEPFGFGMLS